MSLTRRVGLQMFRESDSSGTTRSVYAEWTLIAIAYIFAYLQRVSPQTIFDVLGRDFQISAEQIGIVASSYFYAYTVLQFPAGLLVDRFGVRRVIVASLIISSLGSFIFAVSPNIWFLCAGRILVALGDAVVFSCLIKFVAQRFRQERFGIMSGLSQISGYLGGILATTPLAVVVAIVGWRGSFIGLSLISICNAALCIAFLKGAPRSSEASPIMKASQLIRISVSKIGGWGCAIVFATFFSTATSFAGVWGIPMLMHSYQLPQTMAGSIMALFMIGTAVGSFAIGYVSDKLSQVRLALALSCVARCLLFVIIAPFVVGQHWSPAATIAVVMLGFVGGGTVPLLLKFMRTTYGVAAIGTGAALNATLGGLVAAVAQWFFGRILDSYSSVRLDGGAHVFPPAAYDALIVALATISLAGLLGVAMMPNERSADIA